VCLCDGSLNVVKGLVTLLVRVDNYDGIINRH